MFAASKTDAVALSAGDPYWNNVSLLTNFENNLAFQDGSTNNFQISPFSITPNLRTPFNGGVGGSLRFPGAINNYIDILNSNGNVAFTYGSGDLTIECWVYHSSISGTQNYYRTQGTSANAAYAFRQINGQIEWFVCSSTGVTLFSATSAAGALTANNWYHVAIVRNGNVHTIYVNGIASGTPVTASYSAPAPQQNIGIGRGNFTTSEIMSGFISNFRVVKGTAVYTANFTPPTSPLTAISGTSLLLTGTGQGMFNNSTFVDQGPNAVSFTPVNTTLYSGRSPFGNSYFGSLLFGGSLLLTTNSALNVLSGGDFTLEAFVYLTGTPGAGGSAFLSKAITGGGWSLRVNSSLVCFWSLPGIADYTFGPTLSLNTWYHIAVCRVGTVVTGYVNGVQYNFTSTNRTGDAATSFQIGADSNQNTSFWSGNISNVRVLRGTALYTSSFTPPTTPLTAVTNTSLLVRGDTGAFYDLSNNGNPEANTGTTAVTTQIKKYGSESASYTATAYQTVSDATNLQLGTGDYTIEMWVYRNAAGVLHSLACKGASSTGWLLQVNTSNQLVFTVNRTDILTSTTTIGATIWAFVTVTRSGTTTRLFVNGNLEATATDSTNFNQTDALKIGADRSNLNSLNGYLDDIRITKGVARYTSSFTAPTQTFPTGP